jgi:hypothetical protein
VLQFIHFLREVGMQTRDAAQLHERSHALDVPAIARSLRRTDESIATPCSVKAYGRQLKHEICREAFSISADGLIEGLGLHAVHSRQRRIEKHTLTVQDEDGVRDSLDWNQSLRYGHLTTEECKRNARRRTTLMLRESRSRANDDRRN